MAASPFRIAIDARHVRDFGVGTYIVNLIRSLAQIDRRNLYTLVADKKDWPALAKLPHNFTLVPYKGKDTDVRDHLAFPWFLRSLKADIIHIPLSLVPLWMPRPYVVTVHDMSRLLFGETPDWRNNLTRFRFKRGLIRAEQVIAVSHSTKQDLEGLLSIPPWHIRLIYNAPDPRFFEHGPAADARAGGPDAPTHERRRQLERYQIDYPFVLYAGTIRPQKNIPRLVEAFANLRTELENHPLYKDLRLVIIGDEISRHPDVRRAVVRHKLNPYVRFLGFVPFDTLRAFYETAAVFVFPSLYEGFGLPPLEAMASGTPVVTSSVSSLPEVVGDAALIISPESIFSISEGIKHVLLDENLRSKLVSRGFEQARKFSWERTARQVLSTYEEFSRRPAIGPSRSA